MTDKIPVPERVLNDMVDKAFERRAKADRWACYEQASWDASNEHKVIIHREGELIGPFVAAMPVHMADTAREIAAAHNWMPELVEAAEYLVDRAEEMRDFAMHGPTGYSAAITRLRSAIEGYRAEPAKLESEARARAEFRA